MARELTLQLTERQRDLIAEHGITVEDFDRYPRGKTEHEQQISGLTIGEVKKRFSDYPDDAFLHLHVEKDGYPDDGGEYVDYRLMVKFEDKETDTEWARRVINTTVEQRRAAVIKEAREKAEYTRLRKKFGDMHDVHISELNEDIEKIKSVAELWPDFKAQCKAKGIRIIGEDDECSST